MNDMEQYVRYFPVGIKVGVGIPLPDAKIFNDWAIISTVNEDLMSLQLSRDVLPAGVALRYGQILEIRGGTKGNSYCCRAIVVSWGAEGVLFLRLIGEIVSDELREFYRIDAFLPIKYYVSLDQNIDRLRVQWEERRLIRQRTEMEKNDTRWDSGEIVHDADTLPHEMVQDAEGHGLTHLYTMANEEGEQQQHDAWDDIIPLAANISGGGVRLITHQGFESGEYVLLELLVPQPRRLVDAIARIVFANRNFAGAPEHEYYTTGMQFVYIDEPDRDAIVNYISTIQQKRIRQMRENYLFRGNSGDTVDVSVSRGFDVKRIVIVVISALVSLLLLGATISYFWNYSRQRPKNEIEQTFEEEIKKQVEKNK